MFKGFHTSDQFTVFKLYEQECITHISRVLACTYPTDLASHPVQIILFAAKSGAN